MWLVFLSLGSCGPLKATVHAAHLASGKLWYTKYCAKHEFWGYAPLTEQFSIPVPEFFNETFIRYTQNPDQHSLSLKMYTSNIKIYQKYNWNEIYVYMNGMAWYCQGGTRRVFLVILVPCKHQSPAHVASLGPKEGTWALCEDLPSVFPLSPLPPFTPAMSRSHIFFSQVRD